MSIRRTTGPVGVAPVGQTDVFAAEVIAAHISGYFLLPAECLPVMALPPGTFDSHRFQHNAVLLISALEKKSFEEFSKVIAVMDVDIFIPIFTHVFGEARQGGKVALVSLFRLRGADDDSPPSTSRMLERAAKIALHELGHLFGLLHCDDERCLMHFSGDVDEVDRLPLNLCRYCRMYLKEAV